MDDPPPSEPGDETGIERDRGSITGAPRWVKVFGVIALVLVAVVVVVAVVGGGEHGPGRHMPGGGSDTPSDTPGGHTGPPPGLEHGDQQP